MALQKELIPIERIRAELKAQYKAKTADPDIPLGTPCVWVAYVLRGKNNEPVVIAFKRGRQLNLRRIRKQGKVGNDEILRVTELFLAARNGIVS